MRTYVSINKLKLHPLKRSVIDNVFFRSVKEIIAAVTAFIERIHKSPMETVNRFCVRL